MAKFRSSPPGDPGGMSSTGPTEVPGHVDAALALLVKVVTNAKTSPRARVAAADALLAHCRDADLQERARRHTHDALDVLVAIMNDEEATSRTRLAAASALLECTRGQPGAPAAVMPQDRQPWLEEIKRIREAFARPAEVVQFERTPQRTE